MKKQDYILAIDQGTTSSRAIIFNRDGAQVASAQQEFPQYFPQPGWVEQDGFEIWSSVLAVITTVLGQSGIQPHQIAGIGITNQRETTLIWDKATGMPIHRAIVWQSRQTAQLAEQLKVDGYETLIHQKTGLMIDAYFSATKIRWLLDHVPGSQARAERGELLFGTIDTWLMWKLSGGAIHATDYTNASRTMLYNIHTLQWDQELLNLLNIPQALLPSVHPNVYPYGQTHSDFFFGSKVPICGIAGDQQAALFGQQALQPGMVKSTYGTGAFIMMNVGETPKFSSNQLLTTIAYGIDNRVCYALEGSIFIAGSAIQWLRDGLQILPDAQASETMIAQANHDQELYLVPAFTGLGAPYWDSDVRGSLLGLTRGATKADVVLATLQAVAYQVCDVITTMQTDTQLSIPLVKVDGGMTNNQYFLQFQTDMLGLPVQKAIHTEATALGVAYFAGLGCGFWENLETIQQLPQVQSCQNYTPQMVTTERQRRTHNWQLAVQVTREFKPQPKS